LSGYDNNFHPANLSSSDTQRESIGGSVTYTGSHWWQCDTQRESIGGSVTYTGSHWWQ